MGSGSKFNSNLSTRGGKANFIMQSNISFGDPSALKILDEMSKEGTKYSKEKIIFVAKLENGQKIFLETGNSSKGMQHILERHGDDFMRSFNIKKEEIEKCLCDTISKGKLISSKVKYNKGIPYYCNKYYYQGKYSIIYGISDNGYIETAYPKRYGDNGKWEK